MEQKTLIEDIQSLLIPVETIISASNDSIKIQTNIDETFGLLTLNNNKSFSISFSYKKEFVDITSVGHFYYNANLINDNLNELANIITNNLKNYFI